MPNPPPMVRNIEEVIDRMGLSDKVTSANFSVSGINTMVPTDFIDPEICLKFGIETMEDYREYEARVVEFLVSEGLNGLALQEEEPEEMFSWLSCDCCYRPGGGYRLLCCGYNPNTGEVQKDYEVCTDCAHYFTYGKLDDMTMMRLEEGE